MPASFFVHVLRSQSTGKRYVGQTCALSRRLVERNSKESAKRYTFRNKGPWQLVHSECYATSSGAMRREKWLKSGQGRQWLDRQTGRASPPKAD